MLTTVMLDVVWVETAHHVGTVALDHRLLGKARHGKQELRERVGRHRGTKGNRRSLLLEIADKETVALAAVVAVKICCCTCCC